jgi:hypothetical protein
MSDSVRSLERRFHETGALADEIAWLAERLRTGELTRERAGVAALCGHKATQKLLDLGCDGMSSCFKCYDAVELLAAFKDRAGAGGQEAELRVTIAAARAFQRFWTETHARGGMEALSDVLWRTHHPREGRLLHGTWDAFRQLVERAIATAESRVFGPEPRNAELGKALEATDRYGPGFDLRPAKFPIGSLLTPDRPVDWVALGYEVPRRQLLDAIAAELIPWALGSADPVRERVDRAR